MFVGHYWEKIKSLEEVQRECADLRAAGKKIAFTNGCFDILHPGHTRYLYKARASADFLVVALNSDASLKALKGPGRPILPEEARAELLAALGFVDAVVIFDEDTPLKLIKKLLPDVLVKGADWSEEEIVGADVVKEAGGEVKRIPVVEGFSTSSIVERIVASSAET
ncbi:MAG: D-glycero-beta-D-manno-heptose 1-phosphate adenylyltransferase [Deltaproteobacteria bacterium]|nr:MAG: D-glycero-beta-D-manno-heptose 1-phosphate adenylyltransferase [Deltaproteobacteria bacterium]